MSELSYYESRPGNLSCNPDEAFNFITDLRNFGRFIQEGTITNWKADKDSCSFNVSMLGTVSVRVIEKEAGKKVVYQGDALSRNDFKIKVVLSASPEGRADVRLQLTASLNPMMKMMADKAINQFMEILINEIENFRDWHDIKEQSQLL
ncbi:MAG TPA: hypothetical protein VMV47_17030 [Bacteroidales bacterium]|nr:hypothetical protein [Bacteroidales bacterium]